MPSFKPDLNYILISPRARYVVSNPDGRPSVAFAKQKAQVIYLHTGIYKTYFDKSGGIFYTRILDTGRLKSRVG